MADLRAKVTYLPKTGTIDNITLPSQVEEFSGTADALHIPSIGQQFFQLSKDNEPENASYGLEEGVFWRGTSQEKYNGFVSFSNANKDKVFETESDVTVRFTGSNITGFTIYFDSVAQQWATELTVNGQLYSNTGSIFAWKGDTTSIITIVLKKWNRANVPARITSVVVGLEVEYEKDRFTFVKRGMQVIEDNSRLSWGVLGQYGSLSIIDTDKEIKDMASVGILKSGVRIPIVITLDGNEIANYIGNKWSYAFENNLVTVEMVSNIEKLNNTIFKGNIGLGFATNIVIFNELKALTEQNGMAVKFDTSMTDYINNISQFVLELKQSTLLEAWNKFCNATGTRFYFNEHGDLVLIYYI